MCRSARSEADFRCVRNWYGAVCLWLHILRQSACTEYFFAMTRLVGLTGGIACGKSLVAANLGNIFVIDCDELARKCTKKVRALCRVTFHLRLDAGLK